MAQKKRKLEVQVEGLTLKMKIFEVSRSPSHLWGIGFLNKAQGSVMGLDWFQNNNKKKTRTIMKNDTRV